MAITKITKNAFPASIDLSSVDLTIGNDEIVTANIADTNVTHAKLHTDMNLSSKTVTLPTISSLTVSGGTTHLDGRNSAGLTLDLAGTGHYTIREHTTDDIVKLGGTGSVNFIAHNISSGNVGIGTDSPARPLHVTRGDGTGTVIRVGNTGTSNATIEFSDTGTTDTISIGSVANDLFLKSDDGDIVFATTGDPGTASMTVKRGGNVGIGATVPTFGASGFGLEVKGTGRPTVRVAESTNGNAVQLSAIDGAAILESRSSGMDLVFGTSGAEKMRIDDANGYAQINSASQIRLSLGNVGTPGTNTANWIRGTGNSLGLNAASDNIHFEIGGSEKFKITASGGALFNSGQDINQNFHVKSSGNANSFFIDGNGGYVGIGITTPYVGGVTGNGRLNVYHQQAGQWVMQGRADVVGANGLFIRAGDSVSDTTALFTGRDENDVHMKIRADGYIGLATDSLNSHITMGKLTTSKTDGKSIRTYRSYGDATRTNHSRIISYGYNPGYNQYTYHRIILGGGVYGDGATVKYKFIATTGHASGHGYVEGIISLRASHSTSKMDSGDRHTVICRHSVSGSYYGWTSTPDVTMFASNNTNSNAAIIMRCEGHVNANSGSFDGSTNHTIHLEILGSDHNASQRMEFIGHSSPSDMGSAFSRSVLSQIV